MDRNMIYATAIHLREHLRHTPYKTTLLYRVIEELLIKTTNTQILSDDDIDELEKAFIGTDKIGSIVPSMTLDGTLGVLALVLRVYSSERRPALRIAIAAEHFRAKIKKK